MATSEMAQYSVQCHCGRVKARIQCSRKALTVCDCNCSDCKMRRNLHFVIPETDLTLDMNETLEDASILYEWGTNVAKRRFCKTCGILPWYTPRSNPDGYAITLTCVDFGMDSPEIVVKSFDGEHWEEAFAASNLASQSK